MNWRVSDCFHKVGEWAADCIEATIRENPKAHLCLTTGHSPTSTFAEVARRSKINLSQVQITKLDEWLGVSANHPAACEHYLQTHVIQPWGISASQYLAFDALAPEYQAEIERIKSELAERGEFDLCILGLGKNGHIGLNEPAEVLISEPHLATVADSTLSSGAIASVNPRPTHGLTMGIGNLLRSKHVLLLIAGEGKEEATTHLTSGVITSRWPVSLLQLHPHVTVLQHQVS
jgi:galactosamine-6-phosphate isomerase